MLLLKIQSHFSLGKPTEVFIPATEIDSVGPLFKVLMRIFFKDYITGSKVKLSTLFVFFMHNKKDHKITIAIFVISLSSQLWVINYDFRSSLSSFIFWKEITHLMNDEELIEWRVRLVNNGQRWWLFLWFQFQIHLPWWPIIPKGIVYKKKCRSKESLADVYKAFITFE